MQSLVTMTFGRAVRCFLTGTMAILPVVITVAVVVWVADFVRKLIGPSTLLGDGIRGLGLTIVANDTAAYVIGAVLVLVGVFFIGVAVEAGAKGLIQRLSDAVLQRIPLIGNVYGTSKQLVAMLDKKEDGNLKGTKAVFCVFGKENGVGVLALLVSPERFHINGRDYQIVIVPTSPVPVGGGLLFVPVEMVQPADVSVEGLMSIYVSMGVTAPQLLAAGRGNA